MPSSTALRGIRPSLVFLALRAGERKGGSTWPKRRAVARSSVRGKDTRNRITRCYSLGLPATARLIDARHRHTMVEAAFAAA